LITPTKADNLITTLLKQGAFLTTRLRFIQKRGPRNKAHSGGMHPYNKNRKYLGKEAFGHRIRLATGNRNRL